jgi:hypothetical protein
MTNVTTLPRASRTNARLFGMPHQGGEAMTPTREKFLAAIHGDIDPDFAEAIEQCLAVGWIVQDGERPDGNRVMRPAYKITDAGRAVLRQ